MQSLGGLSPPKQTEVLRRGLRPPRNQPCLREVFPQYPRRSDLHEALQCNDNGWHLITKVKWRWPSMSSPTPNREIDEVRNSEKLHDDTEHCMLVLAVLGNQNFYFHSKNILICD